MYISLFLSIYICLHLVEPLHVASGGDRVAIQEDVKDGQKEQPWDEDRVDDGDHHQRGDDGKDAVDPLLQLLQERIVAHLSVCGKNKDSV